MQDKFKRLEQQGHKLKLIRAVTQWHSKIKTR
jgi:hypothetical protein